MKINVHDTAPVWNDYGTGDALRESIELARRVEAFGYHRYWVAEHHATPALASSSPATLAGSILAATTSIRVGSGAVLLPNHSPLSIAEQFGMLGALHPGRVDLGVGRGQGGSAEAAARLGDRRLQSFEDQMAELQDYLRGSSPIPATPLSDHTPPVWVVGNSESSAVYAGHHGLPYVYAEIIRPGFASPTLDAYRASFRPSRVATEPVAGVAVAAVLANTDEEARRLAKPFLLGQLWMRTRDPLTRLPTVKETEQFDLDSAGREFIDEKLSTMVVGSPTTIAPRLRDLIDSTRVDELFVLTQVPGIDARSRSYELLAETVG